MDDLSTNPYQSTTQSFSSKCERSPYAILTHFHSSTGFAKMVSSLMSYFLRTRGRTSLTLNPEGVMCKRDFTPLSNRCVTSNNCLTDKEYTHAEGAEAESENRTVEVNSPHGKKDETILHQDYENRFSKLSNSLSFDSSGKLNRRQLINQKLCKVGGIPSRQRTEAFSAPCLPRKHCNNFLYLEQKPDVHSFGSDCCTDSALSNSSPKISKGEIYELCSDFPHVETSFCATPVLRTALISDSFPRQRKKVPITTIDRIGVNTRFESEAKYYAQPRNYSRTNSPLNNMTTNDYRARKHCPQTSRMVFPDMISRNDTYDSGFLSQKLYDTNSIKPEKFQAFEVKRRQLAPVQNSTEINMQHRNTHEGMSRNVPTPYNVTAFSYEPTDRLSVNCNQPVVTRTGPYQYKIRRDASTLSFEERFPSVGDDILPWDMPCNQLPSLATMATEQMIFHSPIQPINIGVETTRSDSCIIHTKADAPPSHDASRQIIGPSPVASASPKNQPKIHYSPHPAKVVATDIFLGKASPMAPTNATKFESFHVAKSKIGAGDTEVNSGIGPTRPLAKRKSKTDFYVNSFVQRVTGLDEETEVTSGHKYTGPNHCEIKTSKKTNLNEKEPKHNLKTFASGSNKVLKKSLTFNRQNCSPRNRMLSSTTSEAKNSMSEYNGNSEHVVSKKLFEGFTQSSGIIYESGVWKSCEKSDAIDTCEPDGRTASEPFDGKNGSLSYINYENEPLYEDDITEITASSSSQIVNSQESGMQCVRNQNESQSPPINCSNTASERNVNENIEPKCSLGNYSQEESVNPTGPSDENALLTVKGRSFQTIGSNGRFKEETKNMSWHMTTSTDTSRFKDETKNTSWHITTSTDISRFEEETKNASWQMTTSTDTLVKTNTYKSDNTIENTTATTKSESFTETQHDSSAFTSEEDSNDVATLQEESDDSHDSESEVSSALSVDSHSGQDDSTGSSVKHEIVPISLHHEENSCDIATPLTPSTLHVVYGYPTPSLLENWIDLSPRRFRRNYDNQDERYQEKRTISRIHFSSNIEDEFSDISKKEVEPKPAFKTSNGDINVDEKKGMGVDIWNSVKEKKKIVHSNDSEDVESDEYQDAVSISSMRGQSREKLLGTMTEGTGNISKTNFSSSTMLCASSSESNYKTVDSISQNVNEELVNDHNKFSNTRDKRATVSIKSYNHETYTVDPKNNPFQLNTWSENLKELNKDDVKSIFKSPEERSSPRIKRRNVSDIRTNAEDAVSSMASFDNKTCWGRKNGASLKISNSCGIDENLVVVEGMTKTHTSIRGNRGKRKHKAGSRERNKISNLLKDGDEQSLDPRVRCRQGDFKQIGSECLRKPSEEDFGFGSSLPSSVQSLRKMQKKLSNKNEQKTKFQKHCSEKDDVISNTMSFISDVAQYGNSRTFLSSRCEDVNEYLSPEEGSNCTAMLAFGKMNVKEKKQAHEAASNVKHSTSESWKKDQISTRWKNRFASEKKMPSHGDGHENSFGYFVQDLKGTYNFKSSEKEKVKNYSSQTPAFHSVSQGSEEKLLVDTSQHRLLVSNAHGSKSPLKYYYTSDQPAARVELKSKHPKLNDSENEKGNDSFPLSSPVPENELFYDVMDH